MSQNTVIINGVQCSADDEELMIDLRPAGFLENSIPDELLDHPKIKKILLFHKSVPKILESTVDKLGRSLSIEVFDECSDDNPSKKYQFSKYLWKTCQIESNQHGIIRLDIRCDALSRELLFSSSKKKVRQLTLRDYRSAVLHRRNKVLTDGLEELVIASGEPGEMITINVEVVELHKKIKGTNASGNEGASTSSERILRSEDTQLSAPSEKRTIAEVFELGNQLGEKVRIKDLNALVKLELCKKLNIECPDGCNYQDLAARFDMSSDDIHLISQEKDRTQEVLKWAGQKPENTVAKLREILVQMERDDCVAIIDERYTECEESAPSNGILAEVDLSRNWLHSGNNINSTDKKYTKSKGTNANEDTGTISEVVELHKKIKGTNASGNEGASTSSGEGDSSEELSEESSCSKEEDVEMCQVDVDTFQYVKARYLALQFMTSNRSCVRAIPYLGSEDVPDKSISMCLYLHTHSNGIPAELRKAAEDMFAEYKLEYFDLEREPLGEFVAPRFSNNPSEVKEMADLAANIENNLDMFENRLNVTAVEPSYKTSSLQEEDELCVTVYVLGKGRIPVGEEDFSEIKHCCNCPLNIVEGYFVPTGSSLPIMCGKRPLRVGAGIGVKGETDAGTLGGFLKDDLDNKYILSCEHVLGKGSRDGKSVIVQPAEDDARDAEKELSNRREENNIKIKKKEERSEMALDDNDKKKLSKGIKKLKRDLEDDDELRRDAVSRDIATYCDGLRENWEYNGQKIFVDIAVAQLSQQEVEEITQVANDNGTILGFNGKKRINGKITNWCEFEGDKSEIKFWKSGRTTEHTEGGKLYRTNFFKIQQGYSDVDCFAELTHCNFMTYCESCAKLMGNSNLIAVNRTCYKKQDLKCGKCNREIPKEKTATIWARNCFIILNMKEKFSDDGDSGSVVFDDEGSAWGIIIGSFISGHFNYTVAIPIDIAIKALEQKSGKKFSFWCHDPDRD